MQKEGRKKQARLHVHVHVVPFIVIPSCKTGKRNVTKVTKPAVVHCTALVLSDSLSLINSVESIQLPLIEKNTYSWFRCPKVVCLQGLSGRGAEGSRCCSSLGVKHILTDIGIYAVGGSMEGTMLL